MPLQLDNEPQPGESAKKLMSLSNRQNQVIACLVDGKPDKQIAGDLGISEETVADHLRKLYAKLGVNSRTQAVARILKTR